MKQINSRKWMVTSWNNDFSTNPFAGIPGKLIKYGVACEEEGGKEGGKHRHIGLWLTSPRRGTWVQKALNDSTAHLDIPKSKVEQVRDYILHEGNHKEKQGALLQTWEVGDIESVGQGQRNDLNSDNKRRLAELIEEIKTGDLSFGDLISMYPDIYVRYAGNLMRIEQRLTTEKWKSQAQKRKEEVDKATEEALNVFYWLKDNDGEQFNKILKDLKASVKPPF